MPIRRTLVVTLALALPATGCSKDQSTAPSTPPDPAAPAAEAPAQTEVVANLDAQPGDTTTCPFSGRPFVVKADHPKVEYEGNSYWICSEKAAESVRADPGKYLDGFEG